MKVYPVADRPLLRDPEKGDFVPADGREVADSLFWRRRLRDKDASLAQQIFPAAALADVTEAVAAEVATDTQDSAEAAPAAADESTSAEAE